MRIEALILAISNKLGGLVLCPSQLTNTYHNRRNKSQTLCDLRGLTRQLLSVSINLKMKKNKTFNDLEWDQAVDFNLSPDKFEKHSSSILLAEGGDSMINEPMLIDGKGMDMGGGGGCGQCDNSMGSGASCGNSNSSQSG